MDTDTKKLVSRLAGLFPAMKEKDFRLFFWGQTISWSGNWLQVVALGWLVKTTLHGSAKDIGIIAALPQLVAASLSFFGGTITDRFDEKKILYTTQGIQMVQAILLGYLTVTNQITIGLVKILAIVLGLSNALDRPTTHTLLMKVAGKEVRSAVAMNGSLIMLGASLGGLLASILIPLVGIGGTFIVNAVSFIPIFWTLALIKTSAVVKHQSENPFMAMKNGWLYLWREKIILFQIIINGAVVVVGFSYRAILPEITTTVFHAGSFANGQLYTALGVGSLLGTIVVSASQDELNKEASLFQRFIVFGPLVSGASLMAFILLPFSFAGLVFIAISGGGIILSMSTLRGSIQHSTEPSMRGRVMGFVFTVFLGGISLGSWLSGVVANTIGPIYTVIATATLSLILGVYLHLFRRRFLRR